MLARGARQVVFNVRRQHWSRSLTELDAPTSIDGRGEGGGTPLSTFVERLLLRVNVHSYFNLE